MTIIKGQKYFFDANNFDVPDEPEVDVNAPPPPPVFTLEELAQTKDEGFHQGRLTGLEEAQVSREQYIAGQLEKIAHEMKGVILAEKMREKTYESEVLALCEAIFARAFPALNQQHGMTEILSVIHRVLAAQSEQSALVVDVPPGEMNEIRAHLERSPDIDMSKVQIRENPDLLHGSCRIGWQNGGALRDHALIAAGIAEALRQSAAETGAHAHAEPAPAIAAEPEPEPEDAALAPEPQKDDNETPAEKNDGE